MFDRMFSPFSIGELEIANRIIMPAFNLGYSEDGRTNDQVAAFYMERARGGAGALIIGGCAVQRCGSGSNMLGIYDDSFADGLQGLTEGLKQYGTRVFCQLFHGGSYSRRSATGEEPVAPSGIYSNFSGATPRELSTCEAASVVRDFISAANRAKQCGFDGVELIGSAGYLLSQFLSPVKNLRGDRYAWSEAGSTFLTEIILGIKQSCGKNFPVILRMSGNPFVQGEPGREAALSIVPAMEDSGVDAFNVTGGWHESVVPQITSQLPRAGYGYLARGVKEISRKPVFASNRINCPRAAEELLATGAADAVCIGRGLIADPEFPQKTRESRTHLIRPCIACNQGCMDRIFSGRGVRCAVNPDVGFEWQNTNEKPAEKVGEGLGNRVLVVGGGIAGSEVAIRLAQKGRKVILAEKHMELGGHIAEAATWREKQEYQSFLDYQRAILADLGVQIELRQVVTPDIVKCFGADIVVVATGSKIRTFPLERSGFQGDIVDATELWTGRLVPGQDVVIIGGGSLGSETGVMMAQRSSMSPELLRFLLTHGAEDAGWLAKQALRSARRITIVEKSANLGKGIGRSTRWIVRKMLKMYGVNILTDAKIISLCASGVQLTAKGHEYALKADTIVNATGFIPCDEENLWCGIDGMPVFFAGASARSGGIMGTIRQAALVAEKFVDKL